MTTSEFPLVLFSTDMHDFKLMPDGSLEIGNVTLAPDTVAHLIAFLALPGVREAITGAALHRMHREYLEDLEDAIEDERQVLYARH